VRIATDDPAQPLIEVQARAVLLPTRTEKTVQPQYVAGAPALPRKLSTAPIRACDRRELHERR
jgi:hypothetical protein